MWKINFYGLLCSFCVRQIKLKLGLSLGGKNESPIERMHQYLFLELY